MNRMNSAHEFRLGISTHAFTDFSADVVPVSQSLQCVSECGGFSTMLLHRGGGGAQSWTATSSPKSTVFDVLASDTEVVKQACLGSGIENGAVRIIERTELDNIHAFHGAANFVRAIGWRTVIFKAPPVSKPMLPHRAKRETIKACARFMSRVATQHPDLRLCTDIHYDSSVETVADAEYFCGAASSSNVGITLNIGHMTTLHEPGWLVLERLPQRISGDRVEGPRRRQQFARRLRATSRHISNASAAVLLLGMALSFQLALRGLLDRRSLCMRLAVLLTSRTVPKSAQSLAAPVQF